MPGLPSRFPNPFKNKNGTLHCVFKFNSCICYLFFFFFFLRNSKGMTSERSKLVGICFLGRRGEQVLLVIQPSAAFSHFLFITPNCFY